MLRKAAVNVFGIVLVLVTSLAHADGWDVRPSAEVSALPSGFALAPVGFSPDIAPSGATRWSFHADAAPQAAGVDRYGSYGRYGDGYQRSGHHSMQGSVTAAVGYKVVEDPAFGMDLMVGARQWDPHGEWVTPAGLRAPDARMDAIVGMRMHAGVSPRWSTTLYGDVGGFGAGAEHSWQLVGAVNFRVTDGLSLSGGYRHLESGFDDQGVVLDNDVSGPLLGVTVRF